MIDLLGALVATFLQAALSSDAIPEKAPIGGESTLAGTATAEASMQDQRPILSAELAARQEGCLVMMSGFPDNGPVARYQFFRLVEEMALSATPELMQLIAYNTTGDVAPGTPIVTIIEEIANPVLRQAGPDLILGHTSYLIGFAQNCDTYIAGQVQALQSLDAVASISADPAFEEVIAEDALYLRQIFTDALYRLDLHESGAQGEAVAAYSESLAQRRDDIEFARFESEIGDLEELYLGDLDQRLLMSNDMINGEMDQSATSSSVALSDDMNEAAREKHRENMLQTIAAILFGE